MPLYDFHCPACGHDFERLVRGDAAPPPCEACGAAGTERQVSRVAPAGTSAALIAGARKQAAREGHFSHYSKAERAKVPR